MHSATQFFEENKGWQYLSQVKMDSDVVPASLTMTFSQYQYWDLSLASQHNSTFCSFPSDTAST
jgi:hypothetical protein